MDPELFRDHVRSFEFWFGAVQGYLEGTSFGRRPGAPEPPLDAAARDALVTVLCNYCVGETIALEGAGALIRIAPNRPTKVFLSTQTVDEGRHLEVFTHRLAELGVADPEAEIATRANPKLLEFRRRFLELVRGEDWEAAVFAQNVILEAMEFSVFQLHARDADPRTRAILLGVIKDERRHIGFGENELGRRLAAAPHIRARLGRVKTELDHLVFDALEETMLVVATPADERNRVGRAYLESVERLGFAP
jgi:1,2-phenylacetyl-CoA epoxidase catalytic subunit